MISNFRKTVRYTAIFYSVYASISIPIATSASALETDMDLTTIGQYSQGQVDESSLINPDNQLLKLTTERYSVHIRPTVTIEQNALTVILDPRIDYEVNKRSNSTSSEDSDLTLHYWKINLGLENFSISGGRYLQIWGPAVLLSPSNRYHLNNGSARPTEELNARDFIEASYFPTSNTELQLIANVSEGNQDIESFEPNGDLRFHWFGENVSTILQLSWLNPKWAIGGIAQWTLNEASILYTDFLFRQYNARWEDTFIKELYPDGIDADDTLDMLIGTSYTFKSGLTLSLDYLYNESGIQHNTAESIFSTYKNSAEKLLDNLGNQQDVSVISDISAISFLSLSRHYAVGRLTKTDLLHNIDASLIYIKNLDDNSYQSILNLELQSFDTFVPYLYMSQYSDNPTSEFGRFYKGYYQLGLKWFY